MNIQAILVVVVIILVISYYNIEYGLILLLAMSSVYAIHGHQSVKTGGRGKGHGRGRGQPNDRKVASVQNRYITERKVYSRNGEDGIIESIFKLIPTTNKYYVEFGVESGVECNSRYLREVHGWSGLAMDGGYANEHVKQEFITRENIVELFRKYKVPREFDLLSIDIDGNDYYVWEEICGQYSPRVVVIEYNSKFPPPDDRVIKYNPTHTWRKLSTYFGASMQAYYRLGSKLGYTLLLSDVAGINLFFVRNDIFETIKDKFPNAGSPRKLFSMPSFHKKWDMNLKNDEEWVYHYADTVPVVRYRIGESMDDLPYNWYYTIEFPETDTGIMRLALNNGYLFEKYTTMVINSFIPRDGVFIDVGTNVGCISIPVSNMVPDGRVISFEAFKPTFNVLVDNIRLNSRNNITAVNKAAGHKNMMTTLDANVDKFEDYELKKYTTNLQDNIGGVRIGADGPPVEMVSLDSWCIENDIKRVDVLKVDVEGAEPLVIKGAMDIISRFKPIIIFEKNLQVLTDAMRRVLNLDASDEMDIIAYAVSLGYTKGFHIPRDNIALMCDSHTRILEDPRVAFRPIESSHGIAMYEFVKPY
jgi:FkbM family methyltransferase